MKSRSLTRSDSCFGLVVVCLCVLTCRHYSAANPGGTVPCSKGRSDSGKEADSV